MGTCSEVSFTANFGLLTTGDGLRAIITGALPEEVWAAGGKDPAAYGQTRVYKESFQCVKGLGEMPYFYFVTGVRTAILL